MMRRWWHRKRGHEVAWRFHPPVWHVGMAKHWECSCGKDWWA